MGNALSVLALLMASAACGLAVAVALRVKKILDPLTEEGSLGPRRGGAPSVGTTVPVPSSMVDTDGNEVSFPAVGSGPWILAFQMVGCSGCQQQMPEYKKFLSGVPLGRERTFSLVVGETDGVAYYRDELDALSHVIPVDAQESVRDLMKELGVSVFPTYLVVDEHGAIRTSTQSSTRLAQSDGASLSPASTVG
ncbi:MULTISPECIES: hypothetical protein [Streptomyces]|nr:MULTISPECIES: hypothetical protein [Streptomyces]MYT07981.1 hypothetical protein [Streptomyces sp. SID5470]